MYWWKNIFSDPGVPSTSKTACCYQPENEINFCLESNETSIISGSSEQQSFLENKMFIVENFIDAFTIDHDKANEKVKTKIKRYQSALNKQSSWRKLENETNLVVLTGLLFDWMEQLKTPILSTDYLTIIVLHYTKPYDCLKKFELVSQYTIEYLFRFVAHLNPVKTEDAIDVIKRIIASLTHQTVLIKNSLLPSDKEFNRLRAGTFAVLMEFCTKLLDLIYENIQQEWSQQ